MMFSRRLSLAPSAALLLFSLVFLAPSADNEAAAEVFPFNIVACSDITDAESGTTFEVCAVGTATTPAPAADVNGTTVSMGGYSDTFDIAPGYAEGDQVPDDFASLLTVQTSLDDDGNCQVRVLFPEAIDYEDCASCLHCDDVSTNSYTADCTNLPNGRAVTCEPSSLEAGDIFFPLTAAALPNAGPVEPVDGAGVNGTMVPGEGTDETPEGAGGDAAPSASPAGGAETEGGTAVDVGPGGTTEEGGDSMNPEDNNVPGDNSPTNNNNDDSASATTAVRVVSSVLVGAVTAFLY